MWGDSVWSLNAKIAVMASCVIGASVIVDVRLVDG